MCLIVFALDLHPSYPLVLAANRDEFYKRPTLAADYWKDQPEILGGRDQKEGGTWMALNSKGRFSAITNYRDLKNIRPDAKSRGHLPVDFLNSSLSGKAFLETVHEVADEYNGFNLLVYENQQMFHYSNYENKINVLEKGIYGLSNALLDTPWPKVQKIKSRLTELIADDFQPQDLLSIMYDQQIAADQHLPDTGVGLEWERKLSPVCIQTDGYGTCSTSSLIVSKDGQVNFLEKTHPVGGREGALANFKLHW